MGRMRLITDAVPPDVGSMSPGCDSTGDVIWHDTGLDATLKIRKKTKDPPNNKTIWWFVLPGDEKDLCTLDEDWSKVHLQTGWRLESCYTPLTTDLENIASSSNSSANPNPVECQTALPLSLLLDLLLGLQRWQHYAPRSHWTVLQHLLWSHLLTWVSHWPVLGAWPTKVPPIITPRACARGLSVCSRHENRQISSFRHLCVL